MNKKLGTNKGITLIALIITIIILLILAVVSIRLVINNGILGKAESAVNKYSDSEINEKIQLAYSELQMEQVSNPNVEAKTFLKTSLEKQGLTVVNVTGNDKDGYIVTVETKDGEKQYNVSSSGISKIKTLGDYGLKIGDYVNYDATKDKDGNTITGEKASYTSYSVSNASADKNEGRTSGYTSDQVFNLSSYTGGWRVLGIENGQLQLISADIIGPDSGGKTDTTNGNKYYLNGQKGYADGPAELNAIAGMYGQGKGATGARSINVDDINKITGYNPAKTGDGKPYNSGEKDEYNNKVTYYWDGTDKPYWEYGEETNKKTGNLSSAHNTFNWYDGTNWQSSAKNSDASTSNRVKITELISNYYYYYPTTLTISSSGDTKGIARTSKEWEVLFANTSSKCYWLASPFVYCGSDLAEFGLRLVNYKYVCSYSLFFSSDYSNCYYYGVRPVVSLKSDIQIDKTSVNDGSTLAKACIIK